MDFVKNGKKLWFLEKYYDLMKEYFKKHKLCMKLIIYSKARNEMIEYLCLHFKKISSWIVE